jgi:hypothetical protein
MSAAQSGNRTSIRLVDAITEKLNDDPAAQVNLSAYIRALTDQYIARGAPIESTRALGHRLNSKTNPTPLSLAIPPEVLSHYRRYAKSNGEHSLGALVGSALAMHYFTPAAVPVLATHPDGAEPAKSGWRAALQSLVPGETREMTGADVATTLFRARQVAHETAEFIRDAIPNFRISTRRTKRCLFVTRLA